MIANQTSLLLLHDGPLCALWQKYSFLTPESARMHGASALSHMCACAVREAKLLARVHHDNVMQLVGRVEAPQSFEGAMYLVRLLGRVLACW